MKRLTALLLAAFYSTTVAASEGWCGLESGEKQPDRVSHQRFVGIYKNVDYRYSVTIPEGFSGIAGNEPALTNHGFTITLLDRPLAYVYVTAWYDILDTETSANLERRNLAYLKKTAGVRIIGVSKSPVLLASTEGRRFVARMKCKDYAGIYIRDEALVVSNGIEYTIGLLTPEDRYKDDLQILDKILSSWTWIQE